MGLQSDNGLDMLSPAAIELASLKLALQRAEQREQYYYSAMELAPVGIALVEAQTYRFVDTNPTFQHLLGYTAAELLTFTLTEVLTTPDKSIVRELQAIRDSHKVAVQEAFYVHKNGQRIQVEVSIRYNQVSDGGIFCLVVHDLSRHRQAQETIRYQANLVQSVSDAIISTDLNLCIESWNRAAEELYGMTESEVIGRPFSEVLRVEYPNTDRIALLQRLERDGSWRGEQIHRHKNGTPIDIMASVSYIWDSQGHRVGIVGVNRDITQRKRAERLLLLAQKSEHISLLASSIAHDFNNMLTSVISQASLALRKMTTDPARTHIEKAIKSAELMAELTRQLRTYTGQSAFQIEAVDLNQMVKDNLGLFEAFLPKQTRLELSLISSLLTIDIDRGQAQQLVMNLVINAAEAIEIETGRIIVETGKIYISAAQVAEYRGEGWLHPGWHVYLKVIDNGVGMEQATIARIFDPYFTTKPKGSGLGLSATLGIVQKYQGGLKVESKPGEGTTFTVVFPVSTSVVTAPAPPTVASSASGRMVLIVDDEIAVREVVTDILAIEGIKVVTATDGVDGVAKFKHHQAELDLVLLDMKMPLMNGEETFYALRALDPSIKIILSSAYNELEVTNRLVREGLAHFLPKPYNVKVLLSAVEALLEQP